MTGKHRHIIVGGGFSGLRIARLLANRDDVDVTVINPQSNFEYHGSLYRSANGYSPLETVVPYREIFRESNVTYVQDFMIDINPATKHIKLLNGHELSYDSATLAMGYEPEYFGIPGMREFSKTLYSLADALELRKSLKQLAETSFHKSRPAKVIVVGGGPTGVEVASSVRYFFELITSDSRVDLTLIEAQSRILGALPEDFSRLAAQAIGGTVNIRYDQKVIRATKDLLHVADGESLPFDLLIWTAGSSANSYFRQRRDLFDIDPKGRVIVDNFLKTKHEGLYVVGDSAAVQYSGTAHAAVEMGGYVAGHLLAQIEGRDSPGYEPSQPNYAVPVGTESAVVSQQDGSMITGAEGWQLRRESDLNALLAIAPEDVARAHWEKGESLAGMFTQS